MSMVIWAGAEAGARDAAARSDAVSSDRRAFIPVGGCNRAVSSDRRAFMPTWRLQSARRVTGRRGARVAESRSGASVPDCLLQILHGQAARGGRDASGPGVGLDGALRDPPLVDLVGAVGEARPARLGRHV